MAGFKKLSTPKELERLMLALSEANPLGKQMHQIAKDIVDKKLEANLYVDQWPKFKTIISQEFTPRLSEVADLRIFSTDKERILPLMTEANLLDNIGTWQLIHFVAGVTEGKELSEYLLETLKQHPASKNRSSTLIFDYKLYEHIGVAFTDSVYTLKSGYQLREIPPKDAEFISRQWIPGVVEYPLQHRIRFVKDIIARFGMVGIYKNEDDRYPVSWSGQKPGGCVGIGQTLNEYRHNHFNEITAFEIIKRSIARGNHTLMEFMTLPSRASFETITEIGSSQIIAIY